MALCSMVEVACSDKHSENYHTTHIPLSVDSLAPFGPFHLVLPPAVAHWFLEMLFFLHILATLHIAAFF